MERATITELKNGLSAFIDKVRAGDTIVVTDRGVPVAVIEPVATRLDWDERLSRLERTGLVKRGSGKPPLELMRTPGPKLRGGVSLVDAVLEERRTGW